MFDRELVGQHAYRKLRRLRRYVSAVEGLSLPAVEGVSGWQLLGVYYDDDAHSVPRYLVCDSGIIANADGAHRVIRYEDIDALAPLEAKTRTHINVVMKDGSVERLHLHMSEESNDALLFYTFLRRVLDIVGAS
jgi:hypothetical protein